MRLHAHLVAKNHNQIYAHKKKVFIACLTQKAIHCTIIVARARFNLGAFAHFFKGEAINMKKTINYHELANVLLGKQGGDDAVLTPIQLRYLGDCIEELLTEEEKAALENEQRYHTGEGLSALGKLGGNQKLILVLNLGEFSVTQLIDTLACTIIEAYNVKIRHDSETGEESFDFSLKN